MSPPMKPLVLVLTLLLLVTAVPTSPAGTLHDDVPFFSPAIGEMRDVTVYLPDEYTTDPNRSFSVLYFLHGCVCDQWDATWLYFTYFNLKGYLDGQMASGALQPMIVVMPDACGGDFCGTYYTNSELYGNFEDYVVNDVVDFVESNYRVLDDREHRALLGNSMGAYGAARIAFRHPELFTAVGMIAGGLDLMVYLDWSPAHVIAENEDGVPGPPYTYDPAAGLSTLVMYTRSGAFSPNTSNPPYYVDFPLDENGDLVPAVVDRWVPHDPTHLVEQYATVAAEYPMTIWFGCGVDDPRLVEHDAFAATLDGLGLPYIYETYPGDHETIYWLYPIPPLEFVLPVEGAGVSPLVPLRAVPNPATRGSTLHFELQEQSAVRLEVFDVLGRVVHTVDLDAQPEGPHAVAWDGRDLRGRRVSPGVYWVKLTAGRLLGRERLVLAD